LKKLFLNQGKKPKHLTAISSFIQVDKEHQEGIVHSIEYTNDSYMSRSYSKLSGIVICDEI